MEDRGVITINRSRVFSLTEAREVLPVIRRITADFSQKVDALIARLESIEAKQSDTVVNLENQVNDMIKAWHEKIKKLGAIPKGLWLVDLDTGDGYYCWKYPEVDIAYWHDYQAGFTGRIHIEEYERKKSRISTLEPVPSPQL